jgi:carnitine-CoA ligase
MTSAAIESDTTCSTIRHAAASWPDHPFLRMDGRAVTFAEADRASDMLAFGLSALGVQAGDTVATLLDVGIEAVLVWFAINKLGAISAPINTSYRGEYLRHQVADCRARIVIVETAHVEHLAAVANGTPDIRQLIWRGEAPTADLPWPSRDLATIPQATGPDFPAVTADDLAMLIYTSGTTGPSKGCMISHGYACLHTRNMLRAHGMRQGDIVWMPLPLFHLTGTCGLVHAAAKVGATVELIARFSVSNFWNQIEQSGATFALMMGSMLPLVAAAPDSDAQQRCHGQIRVVCGAPLTASVRQAFLDRFGVGAIGSPGYGQTEASIVTMHRIGDPQVIGTSGQRFDDYDVRIFDEGGRECPPGMPGEVLIRPLTRNAIFSGYWGKPEETLKVCRDLWLHTGDIGTFDEAGNFTFVDRQKDYMRKGGENISSMEMEAVFSRHPAIAEACIHAVPSDLSEDEVKITYILKAGHVLDHHDLCRWAIEQIPAFAVPRYYEQTTDLPRTPTGKVRKVELRLAGATPTTWDREMSSLAVRRGRHLNAVQG